MPDEKPLEAAASAASQELTRQLYSDSSSWLVSAAAWIKKKHAKIQTKVYENPSELLDALQNNLVHDGDRVTIECKPSLFGPYLRDHFLTPLIGNHSGMRLGPPIQSQNPIMGIAAQITSQLRPVGLYPPIENGVVQSVLYPSDTTTCGFISILPFGINELVPNLPALLHSRHTTFCNMPCHLSGYIRLVDSDTLSNSEFMPEIHEELRQAGSIWFLDATDDDSECNPLGDAVITELWGGLYASGHLEISSGELKVQKMLEALDSALKSEGYKTHIDQNHVKRKEFMIFTEGFRITMDSQVPYYSLHMDADLALEYKSSRRKFDRISSSVLKNINQACNDDSVELANNLDLDFTYTDSTKAYSVLKSLGAENIKDPLAVVIRDWHRKRNSNEDKT